MKAITRKHLAKVLTITEKGKKAKKIHYVSIGGRLYLNGMSATCVETKSKDGFWDNDNIKGILESRSVYDLAELKRLYKGCKFSTYIREWTTEQVVYGVPF